MATRLGAHIRRGSFIWRNNTRGFNIQNANPQRSDTATNGQAQALLVGLVGFIQPLVSVSIDLAQGRIDYNAAAARVCNGNERQELLVALGESVAAIVPALVPGEMSMSKRKQADPFSKLVTGGHVVTPSEPVVPRSTPVQIPLAVMDAVYKHVFNEMPIRVLAFDANGKTLQLLERNAIADNIISRISSQAAARQVDLDAHGLELVKELARYAILSHTWIRGTPGDVVYRDWETRELPANSLGYAKITKFCEVAAREHGVSFGWMDTVCINKESSTELDESIRSMYRWYNLAHVCVAYMAETPDVRQMHQDLWFTRGWTLQELLAPRNIKFYNKDWKLLVPIPGAVRTPDPDFDKEFADKLKDTLFHQHKITFNTFNSELTKEIPVDLQYQIYKATTITRSELVMFRVHPQTVPFSRKMQLVANRRVTRDEDKVYSLMGLVGVAITVAYGEGPESAFIRLIREIMVSKNYFLDIFNHGSREKNLIPSSITDYLNRSAVFDRTDTGYGSKLHELPPIEPIVFTHLGVRIPLLLVPAFRKDIYEKHIPPEWPVDILSFKDRHGLQHTYYHFRYIDTFPPKWIKNVEESVNYYRRQPYLLFFGVLNFSFNSQIIWAPLTCLSIPIDFGIAAHNWQIGTLQPSNIAPMSGPTVITWSRTSYRPGVVITHEEAKRRGMQILTLHSK